MPLRARLRRNEENRCPDHGERPPGCAGRAEGRPLRSRQGTVGACAISPSVVRRRCADRRPREATSNAFRRSAGGRPARDLRSRSRRPHPRDRPAIVARRARDPNGLVVPVGGPGRGGARARHARPAGSAPEARLAAVRVPGPLAATFGPVAAPAAFRDRGSLRRGRLSRRGERGRGVCRRCVRPGDETVTCPRRAGARQASVPPMQSAGR